MKSIRPFLWLILVAAFATAASSPQCASSVDQPLAPRGDVSTTPLLIGNSPLSVIMDINLPAPFLGDWFLQVDTVMNKGLLEVALEDKFLLRTTVSFTKDGGQVADIGACIEKPIPAKQGEFSTGKSVEVIVVVPISESVKDALLAADDSATGGSDPVAHVLLELILSTDNDKVLDAVASSETVNPKND
jgi:hypothetical protein